MNYVDTLWALVASVLAIACPGLCIYLVLVWSAWATERALARDDAERWAAYERSLAKWRAAQRRITGGPYRASAYRRPEEPVKVPPIGPAKRGAR